MPVVGSQKVPPGVNQQDRDGDQQERREGLHQRIAVGVARTGRTSASSAAVLTRCRWATAPHLMKVQVRPPIR